MSRECRPRRLMGEARWGLEVTPVRAEHFRREQGPSEAEIAQGPPTAPLLPGHAPHRPRRSLVHDIPPSMLALWEHTLGTAGRRVAIQSVGPPLASKLLTLSHLCLVYNTGA